jgi:Fe-S-cluster-containing hydrogenase component 2
MRRYTVITDKCTQDLHCISACLRNAIHPTAAEAGFHSAGQVFVNPRRCIGCGSCMSACEKGAIFEIGELPPDLLRFAEVNAAYYAQ